jgi:putative transposase
VRRTNTFDVQPLSAADERLFRELLDASASLWNEVNYERRQALFDRHDDPDIDSVWDVDDKAVYGRYNGVLGAATTRSVIRKNDQAWRSFFACLEADDETARPPGYWGNEEDGRVLRSYIRNDSYTLETGERSRLEIPVGKDLKDKYDHTGRLRLEVCGRPHWHGKQGQLELQYDDHAGTYKAYQPVTVPDSRQDSPLASHEAALDVGANNLVACTTSTGRQYIYDGRNLFDRFRETTLHIGEYQRQLAEDEYSSRRIRSLYRKRTRRRDHAMNALARDLFERLHEGGVATVYVGDLTDVLKTHWSAEANEKTHQFWAYRKFLNRLATTAEEYGIAVEAKPETDTTRECPVCGEKSETERSEDSFWCPCGYEGHADLDASVKFLEQCSEHEAPLRPMARPVRFEWDDHEWSEPPRSPVRESPKESRTNLKVVSVGDSDSIAAETPARGISSL